MESHELRIGNYINGLYETEIDKGNGIIEDVEVLETVRVVCIDSVGVTEYPIWIENGSRDEYESFEPIPLTEDWLLKSGFIFEDEDEGYLNFIDNYRLLINKYNSENKSYLEYEDGGLIYLPNIKFVHQLQNLFFALTQKELILKD